MSEWLVLYRLNQDLSDFGYRAVTPSQQLAHVELIVVQKTHMKLAIRGQPHSIAASTVRIADWTYESDDARSTIEPEVTRLVRHVSALQFTEGPQFSFDQSSSVTVRNISLRC
jgi:hypothetical protein